MTTGIGAVAAGMPLASPDERRRVTIPPLNRLPKPIFEDLHIIDMVPFHRSPYNDALHRFGHVKPRASTRSVQEANAAFMTPLYQIAAVVTCQIVQNEQHAQGRIHPIKLPGFGKRVPILPPSPFWNQFWSGWALLEDGCQLTFEPGMQKSIRTLIDWFSSQFPGGRSQQRQQLAGLATNILMILGRRLSLWLKAETGMRNGLIRTRFIFTP